MSLFLALLTHACLTTPHTYYPFNLTRCKYTNRFEQWKKNYVLYAHFVQQAVPILHLFERNQRKFNINDRSDRRSEPIQSKRMRNEVKNRSNNLEKNFRRLSIENNKKKKKKREEEKNQMVKIVNIVNLHLMLIRRNDRCDVVVFIFSFITQTHKYTFGYNWHRLHRSSLTYTREHNTQHTFSSFYLLRSGNITWMKHWLLFCCNSLHTIWMLSINEHHRHHHRLHKTRFLARIKWIDKVCDCCNGLVLRGFSTECTYKFYAQVWVCELEILKGYR